MNRPPSPGWQAAAEHVLRVHEYMWDVHSTFDDSHLLASMPTHVRVEVMIQLHKALVITAPFFRFADEQFVRATVQLLRPTVCLEGPRKEGPFSVFSLPHFADNFSTRR